MDVPVDQALKRLNVLTLGKRFRQYSDLVSYITDTRLVVDGGGIRGISSILILQDLMQEINISIRLAQPNKTQHTNVEPHDIFDLVAGTSTGGLIAIMLGKLGMTLAECVKAYDELSTTIFSAKHLRARLTLGLAPAWYSGKGLEQCVVKLLKDKKFDGKLQMPFAVRIDKIAW
jgi:patatin-like phospholipase/acyl hydrolase